MGKGSSRVGIYKQAFSPDMDYVKSGDVDHEKRTVSDALQKDWNKFTKTYQVGVTEADSETIIGKYNKNTKTWTGYIGSPNSFKINRALYENDGKSDEELFSGKDLATVQTLEKLINGHTTPKSGSYTRYCTVDSIKNTFGLTSTQVKVVAGAGNLDSEGLKLLNDAMAGSVSSSKSYTSVSANKSTNAFSDVTKNRSKGYVIERSINIPKGVKSYAPKENAQESEVIFGRGMKTKLTSISIGSDGHIILHERFVGYE